MNKGTPKAGIAIVALAAFVGVIILLLSGGGRSALERYRAGLRARGDKLTFADLAVPLSTDPEEVASRLLLASNLFTPPAPALNLMEYTGPGRARVAWRDALRYPTGTTGFTNADWADFVAIYLKLEPVLKKSRVALAHPSPDDGILWQDTYQSVTNWRRGNFVRDRNLAQALQNSMIADLHAGDLDGGFASFHALASYARANRNELTLVHQMIRIAITGVGLGATWEALQAPGWDEPRLAALQHDWEALNLIAAVERGLATDRASAAVIFAKIRSSSGPEIDRLLTVGLTGSGRTFSGSFPRFLQRAWYERAVPLAYKLTSINADELLALTMETRSLEALRQLQTNLPWPDVNLALTNVENEFETKIGADRFHQFVLSAALIPNSRRVVQTPVHTETLRRMTVAAIAIKRYQLKHGQPPPDLASLAPEFLTAVPLDPMSGKPLCYRLNADGSFVLYSVGEDGKDDGGDPTPSVAGAKPGLWEGRDAVWPSAATPEEAAAADSAMLKP